MFSTMLRAVSYIYNVFEKRFPFGMWLAWNPGGVASLKAEHRRSCNRKKVSKKNGGKISHRVSFWAQDIYHRPTSPDDCIV